MFEPLVVELEKAEQLVNEFIAEPGSRLVIADEKGNTFVPDGKVKLNGYYIKLD